MLAPTLGGPIFVPTQPNKNGARRHTIQADINAAINLGMRAIASPDCHEIHVRMRTEFDKQGKLHVRTETKREKARWGSAAPEILFTAHKAEQQRASLAKESPRPNFFVDHGWVAKFDFGRIAGVRPPVVSGRGLWGRVRRVEWNTVNILNNDRLEKKWQHPRELDEGATRPPRSKVEAELEEDQIPMKSAMRDASVQTQPGLQPQRRARIEDFAKCIAREFHPERIILFGSHARRDSSPDSDVDLLVIMPRNGKSAHEQAAEIYLKCPSDFPVDLLVRTPEEFEARQWMRDWFMRDVAREGVTLYAA